MSGADTFNVVFAAASSFVVLCCFLWLVWDDRRRK